LKPSLGSTLSKITLANVAAWSTLKLCNMVVTPRGCRGPV